MAQDQPSKIRQLLKVSRLRLISQTMSLIVIYLSLTGLVGLIGTSLLSNGLVVPVYACWYPSGRTVTCFIWALQTSIFPFFNPTTIVTVLALFAGMTLLLGRFWCGWICPMGFVEDLEARLRHQVLRIRHGKVSDKLNDSLSQFRYVILALVLIISFIVGSELFLTTFGRARADEFSVPFCQVCPVRPLFVLFETEGLGTMAKSNVYAWYGIGVWVGQYSRRSTYSFSHCS